MEEVRRKNDDNGEMDYRDTGTVGSSSPSRTLRVSSPPSAAIVRAGLNGGLNCILHTVSKFDTLAGVAIKYGVEVADIKRLNGLVTELQMFALKTLQIPLPGRHLPSPSLCNNHDSSQRRSTSDQTSSNRRHSDLFDSFQSLKLNSSSEQKLSPAMSSLQGYHGLARQTDRTVASEGPFSTSSSPYHPLSHHRKSKSVANGLMWTSGDLLNPLLSHEAENTTSSDKWIMKLLRRRQKSEADFTSLTPETLLKEESGSGSAISAITGKGLTIRPNKSGGPNPIPMNLGDSFLTDSVSDGVRKSSSTPSLQDSDNGAWSSIWSTSKWSLKPDFQALSSAAIPKPMNWRNKTALD